MSLHTVRYIFGCLILGVHFLAIGVNIYLIETIMTNATTSDYVNGVTVLAPLTIFYAMTFYRYVVFNPNGPNSTELNSTMSYGPFTVQLVIILGFGVLLIGYLFYEWNKVTGPEDASNVYQGLGMIEAAFAAFLGLTFSKLFPMQWEAVQETMAPPPDDKIEVAAEPRTQTGV